MHGVGTALDVLGWVFPVLLLLMWVVSVVAGRGAIPRNHLVGIRIPPLLRSDEAWHAGHAAAVLPAAVTFVLSLVLQALSLVLQAISAWQRLTQWGVVGCFVVGVVWCLIRAALAARPA